MVGSLRAAAEGNIDPFENYQTCLNQLMTPNQNSILHVYLESQSKEPEFTDFVDLILEMRPELLLQVNVEGETPLHFAARYGHANVVKVLIDRGKALPIDPESGLTEAQKMMRMTNVEKDTVLHVAARNSRSNVVEILTKEDPEFSYSANDYGETPLYIAASVGSPMVTEQILINCSSVDYGGPLGRTALHAAAIAGDYETTRKILEKERNLTKATDQNGWSPLHYAAYFERNYDVLKLLLEYDASAAYIVDIDKRTALHIAALRGNEEAMKEIVSCCPACCEIVDNRGWNALHFAVASKSTDVYGKALKIPELGRLENKKDDKGNTPLHLIAALGLKQEGWKSFGLLFYDERMRCGLNKQSLSVEDIIQGNLGEIQQKEILDSIEDVGSGPFGRIVVEEDKRVMPEYKDVSLDKIREAHLVVAALIATVTFAAAFTLPGGYKNEQGPNQGTAILTKKAAFIAFVISDAIAMVLSLSAVFTHFCLALLRADDETEVKILKVIELGAVLTEIAMVGMVMAFITGTYAVLATSFGLAITTCFIGLSFFFFCF
ncbi:unnamed protein product [Dovyalis caffra]|uniref:PGG domain-containing protein n=1 Tax=Dovyalis caffra TaxID=77055 RepID=A0AAV1SI39_9ROSI|nr:unnamed protein product [Dovyalis caffra]